MPLSLSPRRSPPTGENVSIAPPSRVAGADRSIDMLAAAAGREGREGVACVLLWRGASTAKVEHWLEAAAPIDGFIGFAIGRSI